MDRLKLLLAILLFAASGIVILRWLVRLLVRSLFRRIIAGAPRSQDVFFILKLRDYVFNHPLAARETLTSQTGNMVVRQIWLTAKPPPVHRVGEPSVPADGLAVRFGKLSDGRAISILSLPPPQHDGEAYLAAVVFPSDAMIATNPASVRASTRFFYLNRGSTQTGRTTDLCGWTSDGHGRSYNVGAPTDPSGFAKAIEAKLRELRL